MADGSAKPIELVREGDLVLSRNLSTDTIESQKVTSTSIRYVPYVVNVVLADAQTHKVVQTLTCTPEHPFYVDGKGFVPAGFLAVGNSIVTRAGPNLLVSYIEWPQIQPRAPTTVYNIIVVQDHSYFIGFVNGGIWVHNGPCGNGSGSTYKERYNQTPREGWSDPNLRGESTCTKVIDGETLSVDYNNCYADFKPHAVHEVEIEGMSTSRSKNFRLADEELAKQQGKTRAEITAYRKAKKLIWHEHQNLTTMQLVPAKINGGFGWGGFGHLGGVGDIERGAIPPIPAGK